MSFTRKIFLTSLIQTTKQYNNSTINHFVIFNFLPKTFHMDTAINRVDSQPSVNKRGLNKISTK